LEIKRLSAKKVRISDIVNGKFFPGSKEEMKAGYTITPLGEKVSRVNLIATVTEKFENEDESYATITIDDGTEAIRVKTFKEGVELLQGIEPGNLVLVIGKVKDYQGEIYINGEIVRKIQDVNYENLRKMELLDNFVQQNKTLAEIKSLINEMSEEELKPYVKKRYGIDDETLQVIIESKKREIDYKPKFLEIIGSLDEGDGVEISKLFEITNLPENIVEKTIDELLNEGFVFEPKVGKLKKV
jgi:RPA family protein